MHLHLRDEKYRGVDGFDMSTTPDLERWRSLRTLFRGPDARDQLKYDRFDWKLEKTEGDRSCTFSYEDDDAKIVKTISAGPRPFELNVETTITNLDDAPKRHQVSVGMFAFRLNKEIKNVLQPRPCLAVPDGGSRMRRGLGRSSARARTTSSRVGSTVPGTDRYAAVNSHYFSQALVPAPGEGAVSELAVVAEITSRKSGSTRLGTSEADAPDAGAVYHAKLVYPREARLAPRRPRRRTREIAFFGPKERDILAHAAGGRAQLGGVINPPASSRPSRRSSSTSSSSSTTTSRSATGVSRSS